MTARRTAVVWLVATALLSVSFLFVGSRPSVPKALRQYSDLVLHGVAYLGLGVLAARTARAWGWPVPLAIGLVYAALHGAGLEVVQYFSPPRAAEWSDWLADCAGASLGVLTLAWWDGRRR